MTSPRGMMLAGSRWAPYWAYQTDISLPQQSYDVLPHIFPQRCSSRRRVHLGKAPSTVCMLILGRAHVPRLCCTSQCAEHPSSYTALWCQRTPSSSGGFKSPCQESQDNLLSALTRLSEAARENTKPGPLEVGSGKAPPQSCSSKMTVLSPVTEVGGGAGIRAPVCRL